MHKLEDELDPTIVASLQALEYDIVDKGFTESVLQEVARKSRLRRRIFVAVAAFVLLCVLIICWLTAPDMLIAGLGYLDQWPQFAKSPTVLAILTAIVCFIGTEVAAPEG